MSRKRRRSRREFLSEASSIAAAAAGSSVLGSSVAGCGGETPSDPTIPPDTIEPLPLETPTAAITGPTELGLDSIMDTVRGEFTSASSEGRITHREWTIEKVVEGFPNQDPVDLGHEVTASYEFRRPGAYRLSFTAHNGPIAEQVRSTADHEIVVQPPPHLPGELSGLDYDVPIAFFRHAYPGPDTEGEPGRLSLMDPVTGRVKEIVQADFNERRHSWEPSGERIALSLVHGGHYIYTYNLMTDELVQLTDDGGIAWQPVWNPRKPWILYVDDSRANGRYDEPVLVRTDGSERVYLSGDEPVYGMSGFFPSWDPEGERFAIGDHPIYGLYEPRVAQRLVIYENTFWTGDGGVDPARVEWHTLHPEEKLLQFISENYPAAIPDHISEGHSGVSWSPDGDSIAYILFLGSIGKHVLVIENADGSGPINVIAENPFEAVIDYVGLVGAPTWSRDGSALYYRKKMKFDDGSYRDHIVRYSLDRSSEVDLTRLTDNDADDGCPAWYQ